MELVIHYPGIYSERERPLVAKYIKGNRDIYERGGVDIKKLINGTLPPDTPGIGPSVKVTKEMALYYAERYARGNPLYENEDYAKDEGHRSLPAFQTFGAYMNFFMRPYPVEARDSLLASDLNHSITFHCPVYVGDTLYMVADERDIQDLTPAEGSVYRVIAIETRGSVYNQRGEKVYSLIFRVTENLRSVANEEDRPQLPPWEGPNWCKRPPHYYTDEDWEFIMDVWRKEKSRGADPLYWEDVQIGDRPNWTLEGPIDDTAEPMHDWKNAYGPGVGGTRTLKEEILDPEIRKTLVRNKYDGIYRFANRRDAFPKYPDYAHEDMHVDQYANIPTDLEPEEPRYIFINFMCRDYAVRHITDWMGDYGFLYNIRWGIMPVRTMKDYGYDVPQNPRVQEDFLSVVPGMEGRYASEHGLERDIALIKSYVYDKYILNGEYFVQLAWWIETIEGDIHQAGQATVKLPSRNGNLQKI